MKDPVTNKPVKGKKAVVPDEDDLPEDLPELEPDRMSATGALDNDDEPEFEEAEPEPAPAKQGKAAKPAAAAKAPAKTATSKPSKSKPAAKKDDAAPVPSKALKAALKSTPKEETSRARVESKPDGDTAITGLIRGKGGEIRVRLNSQVIAGWQGAEKNKSVINILNRQRYWVVIKSEDEADALIGSASKLAEGKNTPKVRSKAYTDFITNIEKWRKEIRKFA